MVKEMTVGFWNNVYKLPKCKYGRYLNNILRIKLFTWKKEKKCTRQDIMKIIMIMVQKGDNISNWGKNVPVLKSGRKFKMRREGYQPT